jgi:pilus assembly protein CpaE
MDKVKLVLNWTFPRHGISKEKIEKALSYQVDLVLPFVPDKLVEAINLGQPPVYYQPNESISGLLEDYAFHISSDTHKKVKPTNPSAAWKRMYKRYIDQKNKKS